MIYNRFFFNPIAPKTKVVWDDSTHVGCGIRRCVKILESDAVQSAHFRHTPLDGVMSHSEEGVATIHRRQSREEEGGDGEGGENEEEEEGEGGGKIREEEEGKEMSFNLIVCNYFPAGNVDVHLRRPYLTDDAFCRET